MGQVWPVRSLGREAMNEHQVGPPHQVFNRTLISFAEFFSDYNEGVELNYSNSSTIEFNYG